MTVFPAYFFPSDSTLNRWELVVEGLLTRPGKEGFRARWSVSMLAAVMGLQRQELDTPVFKERSAPFLANGVKRKIVQLQVGEVEFTLPRRTNGAGIFRGRVVLDLKQICKVCGVTCSDLSQAKEQLLAGSAPLPIKIHIKEVDVSDREIDAKMITPSGLSIVSDIDDTIKDSQVAPLRALLANTFLNQFRSIEGMAEVYQGWEQNGASFHYVSSSPWQLFEPIRQLCQDDQFPCGTFHLRAFRLGRDLVQKMLIFRRRGKFVVIRSLLQRLPDRRFLLIGDSGEKDPEIYAKLASKFPDQVAGIFIRNTEHRPMSQRRVQKLQSRYKSVRCFSFDTAKELQAKVAEVLDSNTNGKV